MMIRNPLNTPKTVSNLTNTNRVKAATGASTLSFALFYAPESLRQKLVKDASGLKSVKEQATRMYNNGGISRLYRGGSLACLHLTASRAVNFGLVGDFQKTLHPFLGESPLTAALAGAGAATIKALVFQPIDIIKVRLQTESQKERVQQLKPLGMINNHYKQWGYKGFYTGLGNAIVKSGGGFGLYMFTREKADEQLAQNTWVTGVAKNIVVGSIVGAITTTSIYPFDVLKTQRASGQYVGVSSFKLAGDLVKTHGPKVLYRGLPLRLSLGVLQGGVFNGVLRYLEEKR